MCVSEVFGQIAMFQQMYGVSFLTRAFCWMGSQKNEKNCLSQKFSEDYDELILLKTASHVDVIIEKQKERRTSRTPQEKMITIFRRKADKK